MKTALREPHPTIDAFLSVRGVIHVGGIPLPRLAERVGGTPFFAYDRRLLTERVRTLRKHIPPPVGLSYAIKANPMPAVVQHLAGLVDGFDVASPLEMNTALDTPMPSDSVTFAGPGKTRAALVQATAAGITIYLESEREMRDVAALASERGIRPRVAVRVNPDFKLKSSGMHMGGGPQQFGIDAERVPAVLRELARLDLEFIGLHIYGGSQILRADVLETAQRQIVELAISLARHCPGPVRHLNIGGGFGIPYFQNDEPLELGRVGDSLETLVSLLAGSELSEAQLVIELGRYIVGEAGIYVSRVIDRKESRGQIFLVTDGGLHHQLAASGNFGQVIRRNYPVAIGNRMDKPADETVNVVGCLCTPLDLLADKSRLPRADVGDFVVIFQSGAYGLTASPTAFLSHPMPPEVLV